ncbi:ABC-three component system protein [Pseudomonas sp. C11]|uniref:ABC-three component system protein n=1 Tax=Pseudomonas sp. C11 TaxID=3075550 RepID=UPI002AFDE06B|nr:ABC-three component system protein [Pseudomonas sp. C11]
MAVDELIISHAVKVNSGSGVLISALSKEFSYVLTARHVTGDKLEVSRDGRAINIIAAPYHHPDNQIDCSIIKVEYQEDINQRIWAGTLPPGSRISYVGYPRENAGTERPYKIYAGNPNDLAHQIIVCNLDTNPSQDSIEGMSGGGVYYIAGNIPYLWGVEFRMDDEDPEARYGRIRCLPISRFEEIIEAHQLVQIAPHYLGCFSNFKDDIFYFNAANPANVQKLRQKLDEKANWLIEQGIPSPHDLMLRYREKLLIGDDEPIVTVLDRNLWVAYFEFVIVCSILDDEDVIDEAYLDKLDRKRRFVYSGSDDNWIWRLSDIFKAARGMLDVNGAMLVNSPQENAIGVPDPEDIADVIDDIASSPRFRELSRIDSAHSEIYQTYSVAHLKGLRNDHILAKHREYGRSSIGSQLSILKGYYDDAIKKKL